MVLNPELKKSFDDNVRKSKAKAKLNVRKFICVFLQNFVVSCEDHIGYEYSVWGNTKLFKITVQYHAVNSYVSN